MEQAGRKKILCMYSGGLDSLGAVYCLLTDPKYAEFDLHLHHLVLRNIENRLSAERQAVHRSLSWFRENNYRPFRITESMHDYSFMQRYFIYDVYWYCFMAANIVTADPSIMHVAWGRTKTDRKRPGLMRIRSHGMEIYHATLPIEIRFERSIIFPVVDLEKREIWDMLPDELREMSWSCRTPVYKGDRAIACGKCPTCKTIEEIRS